MPPRLSEGWPHSAASQVSLIVEPANHRADIESGMYRIELPSGAGNPRAVGQQRAGNDRPEMFRAFGITQREQAAAQGVDQTIARGVDGLALVET